MTNTRWICSQIGAREHYALPRAFHLRDRLRVLYTEHWAGSIVRRMQFGPRSLRSFAARFHPDLPSNRVVSFSMAFLHNWLVRFGTARAETSEEQYLEYIRIGKLFSTMVSDHLRRQLLLPESDGFIGYNTGCLETLRMLHDVGLRTIVDQIDPGRVEEEIVWRESQKWPGWQKQPGRVPDVYYRRLEQEWHAATRVMVNSNWSRQALIQQGVSEDKVVVIPLAYDPPRLTPCQRHSRDSGFVVLWLGNVILRKGIQYLIQAARLLSSSRIRFIIAGPIGISDEALASAPANMDFVGPISRDRIAEFYRRADVFVLPTLSDGFGITQLEAMAHGLPVITTPNCGEVVTDGVDGYVVPCADASALASAISHLDKDRRLLRDMSADALLKSRQFSLERLAQCLERLSAEPEIPFNTRKTGAEA
jgi:glycosyltransferase involved in cell wall biosynthesis